MEDAKVKITTAVGEYKRLFPEEYIQFKKQNMQTVANQTTEWAEANDKDSALERLLYETPEKLHQAITKMLTDEELDWWSARGRYLKDFQASKWFIETFPEFKVTQTF